MANIKLLNLGCGIKTSNKPGVTNIDWSFYLRIKKSKILSSLTPLFLKGVRLERFKSLPDNIMVHNLANGMPFENDSADAVYHSHMLEHLDREVAEKFLLEVKRVLKPGGIHRIVVPSFEVLCKAYVSHIALCESQPTEAQNHDKFIGDVLEQSVRKEGVGTCIQTPLKRFVENLVVGDARRRGETHQWAYDRFSLKAKLENAGYKEIIEQDYDTSLIPDWVEYGLDTDENNAPYKPDSLYMEARK